MSPLSFLCPSRLEIVFFFNLIFLFFEFPVAAVDCILLLSGTATIEVACLCRKVSDQFAFVRLLTSNLHVNFGLSVMILEYRFCRS